MNGARRLNGEEPLGMTASIWFREETTAKATAGPSTSHPKDEDLSLGGPGLRCASLKVTA